MKIEKIVSNFLDTNCYLIITENNAAVIDPCIDLKQLEKKYKVNINAVLLTHGHIDHFYKISTYLNKEIVFYLHKEAIIKLNDSYKNCSSFIGEKISVDISKENIVKIHDSFKFELNGLEIKVLGTPGHTNDSVSFIIDNNLFSGDALFKEAIGRCDLPTSNALVMNSTIETFKNLKINYSIYPGHGEDTTLDFEKTNNYYLR